MATNASTTILSTSQLLSPLSQLYPNASRWVVAYSGGVDSHVLLQLCKSYLDTSLAAGLQAPTLCAIHIDHALQEPSRAWAQHCTEQAAALNIPLYIQKLNIDRQPQQSLEALARAARYAAFSDFLQDGDVLLQAHHCDDQAETLLLRLLRGSGSLGLGAMPKHRQLAAAHLYRPLLDISRASIEAYAQQQQLRWVEDPSNQHDGYDRNFLRLHIMPKLLERWPHLATGFTRSARLSAEAYQLTQELAAIDAERLGLSASSYALTIEALLSLSLSRCKNLLRYWLAQQQLALPSEAQLLAVINTVIHAAGDASPKVSWQGVEIYRYAGELVAHAPLPDFDSQREYHWSMNVDIDLAGAGRLTLRKALGRGIKAISLGLGQSLRIRFRQGGEVCRPEGRGGSRKLKKLLQEYAVPYWLRDRVPLIYCDDQLIAVADIIVAEGWAAGAEEQGIEISWIRP